VEHPQRGQDELVVLHQRLDGFHGHLLREARARAMPAQAGKMGALVRPRRIPSRLLPLLICLALPCAALAKSTARGAGHVKQSIVGAWKVESVTCRVVDGPVLAEPFGPRPAGSVFFSADGRFGAQISRRDLKPFAVADPGKGTACSPTGRASRSSASSSS